MKLTSTRWAWLNDKHHIYSVNLNKRLQILKSDVALALLFRKNAVVTI